MAKRQFVFACLALGGCDYALRIDRITGDASSPRPDTADACVGAFIDDAFDDGDECSPWGVAYVNVGATVRESADGLTITPDQVATSSAGCISNAAAAFSEGGVAVEVSSVLTGASGEYSQLQLFGEVKAAIGVVNESLIVVDNNASTIVISVDYDPTAMRWWRLRAGGTAGVIAETSPNGRDWAIRAALPRAAIPSAAAINVIAGLGGSQTTFSGSATFRRLLVCP